MWFGLGGFRTRRLSAGSSERSRRRQEGSPLRYHSLGLPSVWMVQEDRMPPRANRIPRRVSGHARRHGDDD